MHSENVVMKVVLFVEQFMILWLRIFFQVTKIAQTETYIANVQIALIPAGFLLPPNLIRLPVVVRCWVRRNMPSLPPHLRHIQHHRLPHLLLQPFESHPSSNM